MVRFVSLPGHCYRELIALCICLLVGGCNSFKPYEAGKMRVGSFDYQPQVLVEDHLKVDEAIGFSLMSIEEGAVGAIYSVRTTNDATYQTSWVGEAHRTGRYEQYYGSFGLGATYGFVVTEDAGFGAFAIYEQKDISTYAERSYVNSPSKDFLTEYKESKQDGVNVGVIGWRGGMGYSITYDDYLGSIIIGLVF